MPHIRKAIHPIFLNAKSTNKALQKEMAMNKWAIFRVHQFRGYAFT